MKIGNVVTKSIHSNKKNKDYIKFVLISLDDDSVYSGFAEYNAEFVDFLHDSDNMDIIDINYNSALLIYDNDKRVILNKIL